jgi:hypothetical protein
MLEVQVNDLVHAARPEAPWLAQPLSPFLGGLLSPQSAFQMPTLVTHSAAELKRRSRALLQVERGRSQGRCSASRQATR